jgi:predicted nucleic acid-binding protein
MRFWDSSAVVPLCVEEESSPVLRDLARSEGALAVWWGTPVECQSAFARSRRDGGLTPAQEDDARAVLRTLSALWTEIQPGEDVRTVCSRLLLTHPLRAADAMQLSAAILWAGGRPGGEAFVCLDTRLREAAHKEGFRVVPGFQAPVT